MAPTIKSRKAHPVKVEVPADDYTDESDYSVEEEIIAAPAPIVRKKKAADASVPEKKVKRVAIERVLSPEEQEALTGIEQNIAETQKGLRKLQSDKRKIIKPKKTAGESGLKKSLLLHDRLCEFLGEPSGSRFPRPKITSLFAARLKSDPNKQLYRGFTILADQDPELLALLGPAIHPLQKDSPAKGWSYQNLSKYLDKYFIQEDAVATD